MRLLILTVLSALTLHAADAVKAPVEIVIVENSLHNWREEGGPLRPSLDEIMKKTAGFMKEHLKP